MATIIQGNREFFQVSEHYWYIHRIDGKHYTGKGYQYFKCPVCGKLICNMMGGAARHIKSHNKKTDKH